jgi:hypothetical protein
MAMKNRIQLSTKKLTAGPYLQMSSQVTLQVTLQNREL